MTHDHHGTAIGTLSAMIFSLIKPFFGQIVTSPMLQTILNAFIGATVGFFTVKIWNGEAKKWYRRQKFTLKIENIWLHYKSSIPAAIAAIVLLYLILTDKVKYEQVSILFIPIAYYLIFGKKPDNYPTDKLL